MKALLAGVVPDSVCYQGFKIFNTKEIHHHLGLYIFHWLYKPPNKVHGNDFIYNLFGPNENHCHKNFRVLFTCQNHLIKHSLKTDFTNWRVNIFLYWWNLYFQSFGHLVPPFTYMKWPCVSKITMRTKKGWRTNKNVKDYRHMLFVRKDTHIKYSCALILCQKNIYLKGFWHFMLEWWNFLILWRKNTINAQWIISTTQPNFSKQQTTRRKITDSWC